MKPDCNSSRFKEGGGVEHRAKVQLWRCAKFVDLVVRR